MPYAPASYRPLHAATSHDGRTPQQREYRRWYRRLPWTDGRGGGLRGAQLARQPLCEECLKMNRITIASTVDHRRPHRGNWELFVDETNHCSLCAHHHGVKTVNGNVIQNPFLGIRNRAWEQIVKLAASFGLTPADRNGLSFSAASHPSPLAASARQRHAVPDKSRFFR